MSTNKTTLHAPGLTAKKTMVCLACTAAMAAASMPTSAADFTLDNGVQGKVNATVTYGTTYRTEDPDAGLLGPLSSARVPGAPAGRLGGNAGSSDLNFRKDSRVSSVLKGMADIELKKDNFGIFVRAKAWRDFALTDDLRPYGNFANGYKADAPLSDDGFHAEAKFSNAQIVDAYVFGQVNVGAAAPMTIKVGRQFLSWGSARFVGGGINVINPLDVPGAQRPGALPEESRLPVGMIYANLQNSKSWGLEGFLQLESRSMVLPGCGTFYSAANYAPVGCNYVSVLPTASDPVALANGRYGHRSADVNASDAGQFGLSWRLTPEEMNTDLRLFAMNYHSRAPSIRGYNPNIAGTYGALGTGTPPSFSRLTDPNGLQYAMIYPENMQMFAASFESKPAPGTQVFGELAYRPNQAINLNASDLIAAFLQRSPNSALNLAKGVNAIPAGGSFDGYDRFAVTNLSLGATQIFPKQLGAERVVLTGEVGLSNVAGLPDAGTLRYGRSDDFGLAQVNTLPCADTTIAKLQCAQTGFVTASSWGYRLRLAATYAVPAIGATLTPSIFFAQDVNGYSYDGSFLEGRRTLRSAVRADWGKKYFAEVQLNQIAGGAYNNQSDRDTLTVFGGVNF
jgi:hypothetical protein